MQTVVLPDGSDVIVADGTPAGPASDRNIYLLAHNLAAQAAVTGNKMVFVHTYATSGAGTTNSPYIDAWKNTPRTDNTTYVLDGGFYQESQTVAIGGLKRCRLMGNGSIIRVPVAGGTCFSVDCQGASTPSAGHPIVKDLTFDGMDVAKIGGLFRTVFDGIFENMEFVGLTDSAPGAHDSVAIETSLCVCCHWMNPRSSDAYPDGLRSDGATPLVPYIGFRCGVLPDTDQGGTQTGLFWCMVHNGIFESHAGYKYYLKNSTQSSFIGGTAEFGETDIGIYMDGGWGNYIEGIDVENVNIGVYINNPQAVTFKNCSFAGGGNSTHSTTLTGAINNAVTSLPVASAAAGKHVVGRYVYVDAEAMLITAIPDDTHLTVTRAALGTTAAAHNNGANVFNGLTCPVILVSLTSNTGGSVTFEGCNVGYCYTDAFVQSVYHMNPYSNPVIDDLITRGGVDGAGTQYAAQSVFGFNIGTNLRHMKNLTFPVAGGQTLPGTMENGVSLSQLNYGLAWNDGVHTLKGGWGRDEWNFLTGVWSWNDLTGQTAPATLINRNSPGGNRRMRLCPQLVIGAISGGRTVQFQLSYTDPVAGAQTIALKDINGNATFSATGIYYFNPLVFKAAQLSNITLQVINGVATGAISYSASHSLEVLDFGFVPTSYNTT